MSKILKVEHLIAVTNCTVFGILVVLILAHEDFFYMLFRAAKLNMLNGDYLFIGTELNLGKT